MRDFFGRAVLSWSICLSVVGVSSEVTIMKRITVLTAAAACLALSAMSGTA